MKERESKFCCSDDGLVTANKRMVCRDCVFRKEGLNGYQNGNCQQYPDGTIKPYNVYYLGEKCDFYKKGK